MKMTTQLLKDISTLTIEPCRRLAGLLLLLLAPAVQPAAAATLLWTGGHATSSDWSRNANWNTGTAPVDGDIAVENFLQHFRVRDQA